jgi:hypothetical protein
LPPSVIDLLNKFKVDFFLHQFWDVIRLRRRRHLPISKKRKEKKRKDRLLNAINTRLANLERKNP